MSVKIRLKRMGAKKRPFYRIVVADSRAPRDGRFIESLGYYNPCVEPPAIKIDIQKAQTWLSRGAQPTETARSLLAKQTTTTEAPPAEAPAEPVKAEQPRAPAKPRRTKAVKSE